MSDPPSRPTVKPFAPFAGPMVRTLRPVVSPVAPVIATAGPPRLLERVRQALRTRHYSPRTEKAYVGWIRRFVLFHDKRHPLELGRLEVCRPSRFLVIRDSILLGLPPRRTV